MLALYAVGGEQRMCTALMLTRRMDAMDEEFYEEMVTFDITNKNDVDGAHRDKRRKLYHGGGLGLVGSENQISMQAELAGARPIAQLEPMTVEEHQGSSVGGHLDLNPEILGAVNEELRKAYEDKDMQMLFNQQYSPQYFARMKEGGEARRQKGAKKGRRSSLYEPIDDDDYLGPDDEPDMGDI